eukprot:Lithocolla_globosa_v1_NODE_3203_length_1734_cov_4.275759.p1 type:complete len:501 gc:universal NODE_3203_length_1734_cov_4.275759:1607-105(-)
MPSIKGSPFFTNKMSHRLEQLNQHLFASQVCTSPTNSNLSFDDVPGPWTLLDASTKSNGAFIKQAYKDGNLARLFEQWAKKYGPIFRYRTYDAFDDFKLVDVVVVTEPKEVNQLLKKNPPKPIANESNLVLGSGVLTASDSKEWAEQRSTLKPIFSTEALKHLLPIFIKGSNDIAGCVGGAANEGKEIDVHELISAHAFEMIGHAALGEETEFLKERAPSVRKDFEIAMTASQLRKGTTSHPDILHADQDMTLFTQQVYQRYQSKTAQCPVGGASGKMGVEGQTLMSIMGQKDLFTPKHQRDQLTTFMFAGHETTSHSLSWALYEIAKNPEIQAKLQAEVKAQHQQISQESRPYSYADLFRLPYVTKVINETLRLWPVVSNGTLRELGQDEVILGYTIPKGTRTITPHWTIHRDPSIWGEDVLQFRPERQWHAEAFMPFTRPPRDCLGRNLAMLEMRCVLSRLLREFTFELARPEQNPLADDTSGTLKPRDGVWLLAHRN